MKKKEKKAGATAGVNEIAVIKNKLDELITSLVPRSQTSSSLIRKDANTLVYTIKHAEKEAASPDA